MQAETRKSLDIHFPRLVEKYPHPEIMQLTQTAAKAALASAKIVSTVHAGVPLQDMDLVLKADASPRTIADVAGDRAIVDIIQATRPFDAILIEESGYHQGMVRREQPQKEDQLHWYADSLDGTRPFTEDKEESTVGVVVCDKDGNYLAAAAAHPFRRQLIYAARGMGAYAVSLDEKMEVYGEAKRLEVSPKDSLKGGTIAVDATYTPANYVRKNQFIGDLLTSTFADGGNLHIDQTGSNIAYEMDVARGESILGLTDCMGGPWDWRTGEALITEAGGVMIDIVTGNKPTDASEVVMYGNPNIIERFLQSAMQRYTGYKGFNAKA